MTFQQQRKERALAEVAMQRELGADALEQRRRYKIEWWRSVNGEFFYNVVARRGGKVLLFNGQGYKRRGTMLKNIGNLFPALEVEERK